MASHKNRRHRDGRSIKRRGGNRGKEGRGGRASVAGADRIQAQYAPVAQALLAGGLPSAYGTDQWVGTGGD